MHGLSCSEACGIFPDQGLNPCPLLWQVDFYPLCHQGSPLCNFLILYFFVVVLFLKAGAVCWKHLPRLAGEFWNSTGELQITASPESVENSKAYRLMYQSWQCFVLFFQYLYTSKRASLIAQLVKNPPAMHETPVQFLGLEDPLEEG